MRFRRLIAGSVLLAIAVVAVAVIIYDYTARHRLEDLEATCERISRWAREESVPVGVCVQCDVPASLSVPAGCEVNVLKTADGNIVVLLKTEIGWKGNYEGVLYFTNPPGPEAFSRDSYGREEIDVPGIATPVIRRRVNPRFFLVYFDLG